ncbi:MAG TPA: 23S rRNA (guanosine(2251)-2'-O)-methyltransferase RlmB [Candidatus Megaira endosymbiont of Hartmannula sinica]|nr:23S rRNA (guanosine(2251)-2'-O)-methyltransferase RlmB [Candidatus Megaera endosymbiont of Hartmannula sinica]
MKKRTAAGAKVGISSKTPLNGNMKFKKQHQKKENSDYILFGLHSCIEAILNPRRIIKKIYCTKNTLPKIKDILEKNTPSTKHLDKYLDKLTLVQAQEIEELTNNENHQQIAVSTVPLENQETTDKELQEINRIIILDELNDVRNIGAIIRTSAAFGINRIICHEKNTPKENAAMAKIASGSLEHVKIDFVTNISRFIDKLKKFNFWIAGLSLNTNAKINELKKYEKLALVIGSENSGLRKLTEKKCDLKVKIPISSKVESLNASAAASIAIYQISTLN